MKTPALSLFFAVSFGGLASAAVTINYSNDNASGFDLKNQSGAALSAGLSDKPRDGTAIELGYYSLATTTNPFAGEWVPMVGPSVLSNFITMGDGANDVAGLFSGTTIIGSNPAGGYALPVNGTPLTIRFYDTGAFVQDQNLFNAVSSVEWVWLGVDPDSTLEVDLTDSILLWEGGEGSAFRTTLRSIPEPSGSMLAMVAGAALLVRRRRSS